MLPEVGRVLQDERGVAVERGRVEEVLDDDDLVPLGPRLLAPELVHFPLEHLGVLLLQRLQFLLAQLLGFQLRVVPGTERFETF